MSQCTARSKRSGAQCLRTASPGFSVCSMHGSKGGGPIKHGRYSKYAPVRMLGQIEESLANPELVSLRDTLAVMDAFIVQRLPDLGGEEPAKLWGYVATSIGEFPEVIERFRKATGPLADQEFKDAFEAIGRWYEVLARLVNNGLGHQRAESELRGLFQEQAQLAKQETRREALLQQGVTIKQIGVLVALIVDSLRRNVEDPDARRAIQGDLIRALGAGSGVGPGS
jgi:hypothetical protein